MRIALLVIVLAALAASAIAPHDRAIWFAEVFPVLVVLPLLVLTAHRFPLTAVTYVMIALFALILILGGTYTYARVPLGFALQDWFDLARNPYDRIGHFFQGATPAIVARELLLRTSPLRAGKWLFVVVTLSCLGISAAYEIIEWQAAVWWADGSVAFLGTQGDVWDAQWDMFLALCGAVTAQVLLSGLHDRQLARLTPA
ncbi:DUF2238 domain-containing protein [Pseudazoarcus pumilus]|uniref:DUF2238 domain-containing protein n=1 Tax=Pseudazoarcus pumilus TaxID=2067960 RepID=A0A2I6S5U0_9RHOO|nr:DUF2238 domain-containing protein [Pseudazoarcus pumilus]AUN94616.1 hypothetical protein C0099_06465 [Pseudazoarcus pumilus]